MIGNMVDLIPNNITIEKSDVFHLFWRYCQQSITKTPAQAMQEWEGIMQEVVAEKWGRVR